MLNRITFSSDSSKVTFAFLLALAVRLLSLPWSQTVHADAVSRVFLAVDWLSAPHYITNGYWGPLHHYLNAFFIWLFQDWILGPKALNILLSSLTVFPLYRFCKNVFKTSSGAFFTCLIYVLSPVVMRNSLQALAGVSYAFFVISAMCLLSEGFKGKGGKKFFVLAGLSMTLAAATRYEAWVIIAAFTLVGILFKQWKNTGAFWAAAMIFPASWMIGNQIQFGDFLYSVNQNDVWNIQMEGINDNVDPILLMQRKVFFPMSFIQALSPLAVLVLLIGLFWSAFKKAFTKEQLIWLTPFLILAGIFLQKAYFGTLMLQHRFTLTWVILLLPFLSLAFSNSRIKKFSVVLTVIAVVTIIPQSFGWMYVKYEDSFGKNDLTEALDQLAVSSAREMEAIPMLRSPETTTLVSAINNELNGQGGLVLDFFGWDRTFYVALNAQVRSYITEGAKHGKVNLILLDRYLDKNPEGLILFHRMGKLTANTIVADSLVGWSEINRWLIVENVFESNGEKLYRYRISERIPEQAAVFNAQSKRLFADKRDAEFFKIAIKADHSWLNKISRSAFWDNVPLDTAISKNARHMVWLESRDN